VANQKNNLSKAAQDRLKNYEAKTALVVDTKEIKRRDNGVAIVVSVAAVLVALGLQFSYVSFGPGVPKPTGTSTSSPQQTNSSLVPSPSLAANRNWVGKMKIDNSNLSFSLDGKLAPQAVANFVTLAKKGFFEKTHCHRLVNSGIYVLQCGDPTATGKVGTGGTGGPGYNWGPVENAPVTDIYKTGSLAMARTQDNAYSMGSQFFIVYEDSTIPRDKAGGYTVFGKVTSGIKKLVGIAAQGVQGGGSDGTPVAPAILSGLTVK
jgi:peptidyl-prolyl cis-trans isomerase B (cyclophilin B)